MIRRDADIPLKKQDRRALAYLTLRHRGSVPAAADDPALRRCHDGSTLRLLLGFLRAADALNSRRLPTPRISLSRRGRRIRIKCRLREDSADARRIFSRRKKFRLLEEMLDCRIEVSVIAHGRLRGGVILSNGHAQLNEKPLGADIQELCEFADRGLAPVSFAIEHLG